MKKNVTNNRFFQPIWLPAPMLRLLIPIMLGIILAFYLQVPFFFICFTSSLLLIGAILLSFLKKIAFAKWFGVCLQCLMICVGMLLVYANDNTKRAGFIGNIYTENDVLLATLQEPLNEKAKSYKAEATVEILKDGRLQKVQGNIIVYFQKDTLQPMPALGYGSQVVFKKPLQEIKNAGNPGGFDYQRYSAFHNLYYQVFLKGEEYDIGHQKRINPFWRDLFSCRDWSLSVFKKYIPTSTEAGMAEALLIGYRNDLDRDIVQQYTNTGVVHIIAISGMHLGLIYGLVMLLFKPFSKRKKVKITSAFAVIAVLWGFSLLTGAAPSITRSAIMFTFLVLGQIGDKKASIYNSLAVAAFVLLVYDPYTLWDVGFQLSFGALLSIAIFTLPIEKLLYFKRKWVHKLWQVNALTIAAQILTFPIVVFHFHQFPNLFLLTNLIAVPLSSLIIYALIALLALSWIPIVNIVTGVVCKWLIWAMDKFIEKVNNIPNSLTDNIYFTLSQAVILVFIISTFAFWWLHKSRSAFMAGLLSTLIFMGLEINQFLHVQKQRELIIYNVTQHAALDIIDGNKYLFYGDSVLLEDGFLQNFNLKPSRVQHQTTKVESMQNVHEDERCIQFGDKKIMWIDEGFQPTDSIPINVDVAMITGNPKLKLYDLAHCINPKNIVADGTNSRYKIAQWQKQADSLHLRFHSTADKGAFVMEW